MCVCECIRVRVLPREWGRGSSVEHVPLCSARVDLYTVFLVFVLGVSRPQALTLPSPSPARSSLWFLRRAP